MCVKAWVKSVSFEIASDSSFEKDVLLSTCLVMIFISLFSSIVNVIMGLSFGIVLTTIVFTFTSWGNYWLLKRKGYARLVRVYISLFGLVLLNLGWYFNYASMGPMLGAIIIYSIVVVFIWPYRAALVINSLTIVNLGILFYFEYQNPNLISPYPSEEIRIIDVYLGVFVVMVLSVVISAVAKKNYYNKYREARKSDMLKTEFLQNMSHEFRTPLNAVIGFSDVLDEGSDPDEVNLYAQMINKNGLQLLAMVDDLLDVSRIDSGTCEIYRDAFSLNQLLDELEELAENEVKILEKNEVRILKCSPIEDLFVHTDRTKVKKMISHLIRNAVKFTDVGQVSFGYRMLDRSNKNEVEFFVHDSGIGIPKEMLNAIFGAFGQVVRKNEKDYHGIGMGLYITSKLCALMDAKIEVDSQVGKGSRFKLRLQVEPPQEANL